MQDAKLFLIETSGTKAISQFSLHSNLQCDANPKNWEGGRNEFWVLICFIILGTLELQCRRREVHQRLLSAPFVKEITPARVFYQKKSEKVVLVEKKKDETKICIN